MTVRQVRGETHWQRMFGQKEDAIQFQVPQNIDMEDKIIGPLTLIQFLYLLVGGIIDYLLFISFGANFIFWIIGLPVAIFALALAFLKIQDQPLAHFVRAGLVYLRRPKTRLWKREGLVNPIVKEKPGKAKKAPPPAPKRRIEKSELEQLAQTLDTQRVNIKT